MPGFGRVRRCFRNLSIHTISKTLPDECCSSRIDLQCLQQLNSFLHDRIDILCHVPWRGNLNVSPRPPRLFRPVDHQHIGFRNSITNCVRQLMKAITFLGAPHPVSDHNC